MEVINEFEVSCVISVAVYSCTDYVPFGAHPEPSRMLNLWNIYQSETCFETHTMWSWRMPSSGVWRHVDLVWPDVSEELIASFFRVGKNLRAAACSRWFLTHGFFYPEDGADTFLRNVKSHKIYTAPHPRRRHSSWSPPWKRRILHHIMSSLFSKSCWF
jgi:hypothetical protein